MEDDILNTIVKVEEEIRERLLAAERNASDMLCQVRRELDEEYTREEERLAATHRQELQLSEADLRGRADDIVRHAMSRSAQLAGLDDGMLGRCLMKYLVRLLPGESR